MSSLAVMWGYSILIVAFVCAKCTPVPFNLIEIEFLRGLGNDLSFLLKVYVSG